MRNVTFETGSVPGGSLVPGSPLGVVTPRIPRITTTDSLLTALGAGWYKNSQSNAVESLLNNDTVLLTYSYGTSSQNNVLCNVSIAATGVITLSLLEDVLKANGTEASNAVTANGTAGVITTSALTTTAGSSYAITWTNSLMKSTSIVLLSWMGGTNTTANFNMDATAGNGTSTLTIYNTDPAAALNGTIKIGYQIL